MRYNDGEVSLYSDAQIFPYFPKSSQHFSNLLRIYKSVVYSNSFTSTENYYWGQ